MPFDVLLAAGLLAIVAALTIVAVTGAIGAVLRPLGAATAAVLTPVHVAVYGAVVAVPISVAPA